MDSKNAREIMREHQSGFVKLNPRWCAIEKLIEDGEKLERIEQIINSWDCAIVTAENDWKYIAKVKKILEQENMDKTCDNCKYHTDAEEIHGKTPCGTCGREHINFCKKG